MDVAPTNGKMLDSIIKGGAVAIMGVLLGLTLWMYFKTTSNHINHNTEVLSKLEKSIETTNQIAGAQVEATKLQATAIEGLTNVILQMRR